MDQIDNDTIVSGSRDKRIRIWKISTGVTIRIIDIDWLSASTVFSVRVLLNNYHEIACGIDKRSSENLKIYNYITGDFVQSLNGHTQFVYSIQTLSEQYQYMASEIGYSNVIIWDLTLYLSKYILSGHKGNVYCLKRISSNLLASADENSKIIICNWLNGTLVHTLTGHSNILYFSSLDLYDEQTLISGSMDKMIKFWDISSGQLIESINTEISITALVIINTSKFSIF